MMRINTGATIDASTYNANSFQVTNTSSKNIVSISFDTRTNMLRGIVFDPAGTAGDTAARNLKIDTFGSTGAVQPAATDYSPFSSPNSGGYNVMTVQFNPNVNGGFNPNETVKFSVDIDPYNIKNSGINGDAGSVSGFELTGTTVTITYSDGTSDVSEIFGDGSAGGAKAAWGSSLAPAPILSLAGRTSGQVAVAEAVQAVHVTGVPNATVTVSIMTGGSGNNVQPADMFDANKAVAVEYRQVTLNGSGEGILNITVPATNPIYLAATIDSPAGPGRVSSALVVAKDSSAPVDTTAPAASGGANDLTSGAASHVATITYSDSSGVDGSTIGVDDITVSGTTPITVTAVTQTAGSDGSIVASYTLSSSGGFTAADNGSYTIALTQGAVSDTKGNLIAAQALDTFAVNIAAAPAFAPIGVGTTQAETLTLSGYRKQGGLIETLTNGTAKGSFNGPAGDYVLKVAYFDENDGASTMTVKVDGAVVSSWKFDQNLGSADPVSSTLASRVIPVTLAPGAVIEISGNRNGGEYGRIDYLSVEAAGSGGTDASPPQVTGGASDLTAASAAHTVSLTYSDPSGINLSTIDASDLTITGGAGPVTVSGVTTQVNGSSVTATYTLASDGGFTAADNGSYDIALAAGAVRDLAGNGVVGGNIDSFTVNIANSGGSTITGTTGNDSLSGTAGNDTIDGLAGNDTIDGLGGADLMRGGAGNDTYVIDNVADSAVELSGQGTDLVNAYISYTLEANVENVFLRGGAMIDGTGNALNNRMEGNDAANKFYGLGGDDILIGRGGADDLTGGAGNDIFDYNLVSDSRGTSIDRILDFTQGQDKIDLSTIDADSTLSGNQAFRFIGTDVFSGTAGDLRYDHSTAGMTSVFVDIDGNRAADMVIHIDGTHLLGLTDFIL
jgi:Ca2+-binding RTX toxin-like protein